MELVYLWVEDYKNIKKQGFNFSPKFYCEYNDIKKELTINKNDDYIPNFFGENINVTAIVGKNGSGKSSILETISEMIEKEPRKGRLWLKDYNNVSEYTSISNLYYNTILFSDNEVKEISHYNHINQFLREKTHLLSMEKIENSLISILTHNEDLSYIPELDYLPTHVELKISSQISEDIKVFLIENLSSDHPSYFKGMPLTDIYRFIRILEFNLRG